MSRYAQRTVGVFDNVTNKIVLPSTPEWGVYASWLRDGNSPDPLPASASPTISSQRALRKAQVADAAASSDDLGVNWNGKRYKLSADDRAVLVSVLAVFVANGTLPNGFGWRAKDGTFTTMNGAQLKDFVDKFSTHDFKRRKNEWDLYATIDAATDPGVVDVSIGWP